MSVKNTLPVQNTPPVQNTLLTRFFGRFSQRLAFGFALFSFLASALMLVGLYYYARLQVRQDIRSRLIDVVSLAAQQVNVDQHASLLVPASASERANLENSATYLELKQQLQKIRTSISGIRDVYTMRYDAGQNQMVFVVSAEANPDIASHLGDPRPDFTPEMLQTLAYLDRPVADQEPTSNQGGNWLSAYAPLHTSDGRLDGVLGISMSVQDAATYEQQMLWLGLIVLAITLLVMGLLGWWIGTRISGPLERLTQVATRLATGDWSKAPLYPTPGSAVSSGAEYSAWESIEVRGLSTAFNQMTVQLRSLFSELEQHVAERTQELEKRTNYLETTAQLSRSMTTILDAQRLMSQAVEQIQERFHLYFVGIYLVDEEREWAVLRAGTGAAGDAMVARGDRVLIPSGMVGWSIINARPRIAQVASEDEVRLASAELPNTRSEAALPLRSRGRVLGALSLHSAELNTFDEQIILVLAVMADQLAIALDNARLFEQSQASLEAEQRVYGDIGQQAWERLYRSHKSWGYHYQHSESSSAGVRTVGGPWRPVMVKAAQSGTAAQDEQGRLAIPVKVRDEVIGVMSFYRSAPTRQVDGGRQAEAAAAGTPPVSGPEEGTPFLWQPDEVNLLQEILDDVGQAVESARLYQETQLRAAQEQVTGEITANMRASLDMNTVLQTALHEIAIKLGPAMGLSQLEVHLGNGAERS